MTRKAVYVMVEQIRVGNNSRIEMFCDVTADNDEAAEWMQEKPESRYVVKKFVKLKGIREEDSA